MRGGLARGRGAGRRAPPPACCSPGLDSTAAWPPLPLGNSSVSSLPSLPPARTLALFTSCRRLRCRYTQNNSLSSLGQCTRSRSCQCCMLVGRSAWAREGGGATLSACSLHQPECGVGASAVGATGPQSLQPGLEHAPWCPEKVHKSSSALLVIAMASPAPAKVQDCSCICSAVQHSEIEAPTGRVCQHEGVGLATFAKARHPGKKARAGRGSQLPKIAG